MSVAGDTTYLAGSLLEIISSDAIIAMAESGVTRKLVRNEYRPNADTISIPVYNAGTHVINAADVNAISAGSEIGAAYLGSEKKTGTLVWEAVRSDLYDDTIWSSQDSPAGNIGMVLGNALALNIDVDLNALFDAFTGNAVDTSADAVTVDDLLNALKLLKADNAPGPYSWVVSAGGLWGTYGISNDVVTSTNYAGGPTQDKGLIEGWFGRLAGINIYHSEQFTEASSATKSGIFSKNALCFGYSGPAGIVRIEPERQATYGRTVWVGSYFGVPWELNDNYGCEMWIKTS